MKKQVIFRFRESWLETILQEHKSFIEELSASLNRLRDVEIINCGENYIEATIEEEVLEDTVDSVKYILRGRYKEEQPFRNLEIIGEVEGIKLISLLESIYATETKAIKRREKENQKRKEKGLCPIPKDTALKKYPVKFSADMTAYIEEIHHVVPMLEKMGIQEKFYSKNLLISIDDGWGYSAFLDAVAKELLAIGAAQESFVEDVLENVVEKHMDRDSKYSAWEQCVREARGLRGTRKEEARKVVSYDIQQWMSDLDDPKVVQALRKMTQYAKKYIAVFKIPYMEPQVVRRIEEKFSAIMPIRTISVPPISVENMIAYIKEKLKEYEFEVRSDCEDMLEQWICQEKTEGRFFGYKSLNRMVDELLYHKALCGTMDEERIKCITRDDIAGMVYSDSDIDPYKLLNDLVGIAQVKKSIREIAAQIKVQKELQKQGSNVERPSIHMIFSGNPGTGKTTVARLVGKILRDEGVLGKGQFYEVHGRDLCGRYIGETSPKTSAICRDAYGSVLFIDEAYSLCVRDLDRDYGKEAIQTLITEMENHRDEFCVIMSGYRDEMEDLMNINPGLRSRIPYVIEFPNYTKEELVEIFFSMVNDKFVYDADFKEAVQEFVEKIPEEELEKKSFSNARFVRNLYERVWGKAVCRSDMHGTTELKLQKEDLIGAAEEEDFRRMMTEKQARKIGF